MNKRVTCAMLVAGLCGLATMPSGNAVAAAESPPWPTPPEITPLHKPPREPERRRLEEYRKNLEERREFLERQRGEKRILKEQYDRGMQEYKRGIERYREGVTSGN